MPDLSRADPRQTQQGRVTNNRSGILPARRNTEAPALERIADMRSARRGDVGGAEQLMAMFGSVNRAANSFAEYSAAKDERADQTNSAEAAVDAVTGEFDPELAERSRAYRSTFAKGKTEREVLSHITTLEDEVNALLDDLEKQADQDDVDELILGSLKSYLKPNGRDRDFGDPEAKVLAIERLRAAQAQLRQGAHKRIIEQVTEQSLTDATEGYRLKLRMVEPGDLPGAFEDAFGNLLPSVDRKQAKTALVQLTMDYASSISKDDPVRSLQVLDALLGSTRAGGIVTPIDLPPSSSAPQMAPAAAPGAPTGPAASSAPVRITATGAAGSVADGLHSAGLPAVVVAGFLGNIEHESRFRTNGPSGDSGTAHGLVQWRKERVANFRRIIGKDVKQASVAEQVRFIKWEMDNPRAAGMTVKQRDRILQASTPEEAARFIDQFYERSDGKSRGEREAAARRYFGGRENAIPAVAANYSPEPVSAVDQAVAGQEVAVAMPRSMSLGVEDRIRVGEFRRNLKMTIEKQENDAMNERQARKGDLLLDRFSGIGDYPTASEIQEARLKGDLGADQAARFVNMLRADADRAESRAERLSAEVEAEAGRRAKASTERRIQSMLGPVYTGARSVSQANQLLIDVAAGIDDPSERQTVIGAVRAELGAVAEMRERSPAYVKAMDDFDLLEQQMVRRLPPRLRGPRRESAIRTIKQEVDRQRVFIGRAATDRGYDPAKGYSDAERVLTDRYIRAYHR